MRAIWRYLCVLLAGVIAALGGMLWWRKRQPVPRGRVDTRARDEEERAAADAVAKVDSEAQRKIEEASHGGAAALRDRVNDRR